MHEVNMHKTFKGFKCRIYKLLSPAYCAVFYKEEQHYTLQCIFSWFCVKTLMICFEVQSLKKYLFIFSLEILVSDISQINVRRL